ncbi:uroporphyrinogen-III C-methyltransferase [Hylemonella gracilis]|uniref:Uroporphyrin-III C-methyltransferase n=1 Tax=Hylemonella gracilis ATCC 19624 TaxID=887062 RepID=F3KX66_9BURK|nr:uroporphyrinogen-III C-methyltransferase [Hylemonella gracilis]EGI75620.1 uroporphyrin-III C-methyltransferase [Hylemonella gracilis ATCC 19624]
MSTTPQPTGPESSPSAPADTRLPQGGVVSPAAAAAKPARWPVWLLGALTVLALLLVLLLGVRQHMTADQLARQAADALSVATEARALAQQGHVREQDLTARQAVLDARLSDTALQRSQLESLLQSLSRSRDEYLLADVESTLRLAQEYTQMSGGAQPMVAALRSLQRRLQSASPRLAPVQRAVAQDLARIESSSYLDTPALLARLNELLRLAPDLPLANAYDPGRPGRAQAGPAASAAPKIPQPAATAASPSQDGAASAAPVDASASWADKLQAWWLRQWAYASQTLSGLVRVSRIDGPEAALLAPDQSFFLRENLQLLLLNARQALLARQPEAARTDLLRAESLLRKYFSPDAGATREALELLRGVQLQVQNLKLPRPDATLAALAAVMP